MRVQILDDPIGDPRWPALLDRHPAASVFHSPGWLNALRQTYGYEPFVVTTSTGPQLTNGIVVCRVKSWTLRRLVSLPFSDHCDPLADTSEDLSEMLELLAAHARTAGWRSVELRPRTISQPFSVAARACHLRRASEYCFHRLDLQPEPAAIFGRMHHSSTRRAIRRAEREGLTYAAGRTPELLASFYRLLRMTRRRHGLPPQPIAWFRNLVSSHGDRLTIHVASKNGHAIAGMLTLSFKRTIVFKYGGSDAAHHSLGGMPFLFWQVIQDARARGFVEMDLGRSDVDQTGLIAFKDHLGAERSTLTYYRSSASPLDAPHSDWMSRVARGMLTHLPDAALDFAGRVIYKRLG